MRLLLAALVLWTCTLPSRADTPLHSLWELHGKHNSVFLLGSIHVLRPADYPLDPAVMRAYASSKSLVMEINLADMDLEQLQGEMMASAMLPEGKSLPEVLGAKRYARAETLAREVGVELSTFDQFAPWFAAEATADVRATLTSPMFVLLKLKTAAQHSCASGSISRSLISIS